MVTCEDDLSDDAGNETLFVSIHATRSNGSHVVDAMNTDDTNVLERIEVLTLADPPEPVFSADRCDMLKSVCCSTLVWSGRQCRQGTIGMGAALVANGIVIDVASPVVARKRSQTCRRQVRVIRGSKSAS